MVDTTGKVWVGTRYNGLYCFEIDDTSIVRQHHFTVQQGLTDNFVYFLACDKSNNIWAGSQSGLDKISLENGQYIVEGVTRNNNIFQLIQTISVSKNGQVWSLGNAGSVLRITNKSSNIHYRPQQISRIKAIDTIFDMPSSG
jgi:ligand-binding sensor domain-containing protein